MNKSIFSVLIALIWALSSQSFAVIISGTDGSTNTNAPVDDPGFDYVGVSELERSAVYLGNSWFVTANHNTTPSTIKMGGVMYSYMPSTWKQLTNDLGAAIDLAMFKITTKPVGGVPIRSSLATTGQSVVMIGNGRDRTSDLIKWNSSWDVVTQGQSTYTGYTYDGSYPYDTTLRWGNNTVSVENYSLNGMTFLLTDFDAVTGEGQAAPGDSGGGVFINNGAGWELAGIMLYVSSARAGQPANTAIHSDYSFAADLSVYRDQITNRLAMTDVDADGISDDWEYEQSGSATGVSALTDQDGDGAIGTDEYIADTDPTDSNAVWQADGTFASTNQTFTFDGSTARQYQVFYTTNNLTDAGLIWTAHGSPIWGIGAGTEIVVTNAEDTVFYRVWVTLP